jgi:Protein of unknown function (DUF2695)
VDKAEKKRLRERARAKVRAASEAEWRDRIVLGPEQLKAMLDDLDEQLPKRGCDHTLRLTLGWATAHAVEPEDLKASVAHFGGSCDCEVLANVDPQTQVQGWPSYLERFGAG